MVDRLRKELADVHTRLKVITNRLSTGRQSCSNSVENSMTSSARPSLLDDLSAIDESALLTPTRPTRSSMDGGSPVEIGSPTILAVKRTVSMLEQLVDQPLPSIGQRDLEAQIESLQLQLARKMSEVDTLNNTQSILTGDLNQSRQQIDDFVRLLATAEDRLAQFEVQVTKLTAELRVMTDTAETVRSENSSLRAQLSHTKDSLREAKSELATERTRTTELEVAQVKVKQIADGAVEQLIVVRKAKGALMDTVEELKSQLLVADSQHKAQIEALETKLLVADNTILTMQQQIAQVVTQSDESTAALTQVRQQHDQLRSESDIAIRNLNSLVDELRGQLDAMHIALQTRDQECEKLQTTVDTMQQTIASRDEEIQSLHRALELSESLQRDTIKQHAEEKATIEQNSELRVLELQQRLEVAMADSEGAMLKIRTEFDEQNAKYMKLRGLYEHSLKQLQDRKRKETQLESEIEDLKAQLAAANASVQENHSEEFRVATEAVRQLAQQNADLQRDLSSAQERHEDLLITVDEHRERLRQQHLQSELMQRSHSQAQIKMNAHLAHVAAELQGEIAESGRLRRQLDAASGKIRSGRLLSLKFLV